MCALVRLANVGVLSKSRKSRRQDKDCAAQIGVWISLLLDPMALDSEVSAERGEEGEGMRGVGRAVLDDTRAVFVEMVRKRRAAAEAASGNVEGAKMRSGVDAPISFRQLVKSSGEGALFVDHDMDVARATGKAKGKEGKGGDNGDAGEGEKGVTRLDRIYQLTGFADPIFAECSVTVHDYDIILDITLVNQTQHTLTNLTLDLITMGDLQVVEKGHKYTVGPYDTIRVKSSIKVSSTETGHIFGNIVYDMSSKAKTSVLNLDEIHLDIMDYIQPGECSDAEFRSMWAEFEWENKVRADVSPSLPPSLSLSVSPSPFYCLSPLLPLPLPLPLLLLLRLMLTNAAVAAYQHQHQHQPNQVAVSTEIRDVRTYLLHIAHCTNTKILTKT